MSQPQQPFYFMKCTDKEKTPLVVFSDNHVLVAFKPAGLATQPSPEHPQSLEEWAKTWVRQETKKTGNIFLTPIHRLDVPVAGLVLFARSSKALARLNAMMREKQIKKRYHARIEGAPQEREGVLEHFLVHENFYARVAPQGAKDAKQARLRYTVLAPGFIEVELETGRYHQIRAQLAAIGCPIVGDQKYGSTKGFLGDAIALENIHLEFVHPVTQQNLKFSLPYPLRKLP